MKSRISSTREVMEDTETPLRGGYRNRLAAILFISNLLIYFSLIIFSPVWSVQHGFSKTLWDDAVKKLKGFLREEAIIIFFSVQLTMLIHFLIQRRPTLLMHSVCCLLILFCLGLSIILGYHHEFLACSWCVLVCTGLTVWYMKNIHCIRLTAKLMFYAQGVAYRFPELVYFSSGMALSGYFIASFAKYSYIHVSKIYNTTIRRLLFRGYWTFSVYWGLQFVHNLTRTIIYGLFILYYRIEDRREKTPVAKMVSHCLRESIGKIASGCLLAWPITLARSFIPLSSMRPLGRRYNYYAFSRVALCDEDYQDSARIVWDNLQISCVRQVVTDQCVGAFILLCSIFVGILSTLVLFYSTRNTWDLPWLIEDPMQCFSRIVIGMTIPQLYFKAIESGSTATLVAISEDAHLLEKRHAKLYQIISSDYPDIFTI